MKEQISREIEKIVSGFQEREGIRSRWKKPLVGFAQAQDPLFPMLKEVATPGHLLPEDIQPGAKTVVAYFLPFENWIPKSNIREKKSSEDWARAYVETNILIGEINDHLVSWLIHKGYPTAKLSPRLNMDYEKLVSVWSNRHVAYIAGLGTFGLNNMLITEKGCCGRLGNIVTTLEMDPDERSDKENCLHKQGGSCRVCVDRCVNGSLTEESFDRFKCFEVLTENGKTYKYLGDAEVCGKCLVALPCSFVTPSV